MHGNDECVLAFVVTMRFDVYYCCPLTLRSPCEKMDVIIWLLELMLCVVLIVHDLFSGIPCMCTVVFALISAIVHFFLCEAK